MTAKPGIMIALGLHPKPKPGSAPPRYGGGDQSPNPDPDEANEPAETGSISPEEVDYSENDTCATCASNEGGNCSKYHFPVSDTGHCEAGYSPKGEGGGNMGATPIEGGQQ